MAASQFSLRTLLIIVTACCCAVGAVRIIGFGPLAWTVALTLGCCILLAPLFAVWCLANHFAPALTKNGTAVLAMVYVLGILTVCGIVHSREQSRRNQCLYHLTKLGENGADLRERFPLENRAGVLEGRWSQFASGYAANYATFSEEEGDSRRRSQSLQGLIQVEPLP